MAAVATACAGHRLVYVAGVQDPNGWDNKVLEKHLHQMINAQNRLKRSLIYKKVPLLFVFKRETVDGLTNQRG